MADLDIAGPNGTVDKRQGRGKATAGSTQTSYANSGSIQSMKDRLTAINATSYSAARLATMTENDMLYALRLNDDAAGI